MYFDRESKPETCVGEGRYDNVEVIRRSDGSLALASTDGHCATMVACRAHDEESASAILGPIPPSVLMAARKLAKKAKVCEAEVRINATHYLLADGTQIPRLPRAEFPDVPRLFVEAGSGEAEELVRLDINVALLKAVADSLGSTRLKLTIKRAPDGGLTLDPVLVRAEHSDSSALVMPMRL